MKVKPLVPKKKIKYNKMKFKLDLSKPLLKDTDKDGLPDIYDCAPRNPRKKGLGHLISGHRAKKELKVAKEMDLPIDEEYKTELKEAISKGDEEKKRIKENIKAVFKDTDKNFSRIARGYTRRAEHVPKQRKPQHYREGEIAVKSQYLILPPRKMFLNEETGERCSIPHYRRMVYKPYVPATTGYIFTLKQAPLPKYLLVRKLRRLMLYYQETKQYEKLRELYAQLQGEQK